MVVDVTVRRCSSVFYRLGAATVSHVYFVPKITYLKNKYLLMMLIIIIYFI